MARGTENAGRDVDALWRETLTKGHVSHHIAHRLMPLLPGPPRCKVCYNPFGGIGGRICRMIGMAPSRKNPHLCALCCEKLPPGGAEVEIAVMFADVRGSTALADRLGPARFAESLNAFYRTATETLIRHRATIDKLIGDEVMAFFVPGFVGKDVRRAAVAAGQGLLVALGYRRDADPLLPVGIGVDAGTAYVGNVGGGNYVDFTALGDPVNMAARIQAAAGPGEMLVGEDVFRSVADRYPAAERRRLDVEGKQAPIDVRSLPLRRT